MLRRWVLMLALLNATPSVVVADRQQHEHGDRSMRAIGLIAEAHAGSTSKRAKVRWAEAGRLAQSEPDRADGSSAETQATATPWVKLCETVTIAGADKALCVTTHERLDGSTGMVLVSAALREIEGEGYQTLMAMVPDNECSTPTLIVSAASACCPMASPPAAIAMDVSLLMKTLRCMEYPVVSSD